MAMSPIWIACTFATSLSSTRCPDERGSTLDNSQRFGFAREIECNEPADASYGPVGRLAFNSANGLSYSVLKS